MVLGRFEGAAGVACELPDRRLEPRPVGVTVDGVTLGLFVAAVLVGGVAALDTSVVTANQPARATKPPAPTAPVMRRARRAGCGLGRRWVDSMRDIIEPQSQDTLGAPWASASMTLSVVRPPIAAVATMNAVRKRNVSLSVPAVTPWTVASMNNGKLK